MVVVFGLLFCFIVLVIFFYMYSLYLYNVYVCLLIIELKSKGVFLKVIILDCFEIYIFYIVLILFYCI